MPDQVETTLGLGGRRQERVKLREMVGKYLPKESGGMIVRTVAEGTTEEHFKREVESLLGLWKKINKKTRFVRAPALVQRETSLTRGIIRDLFSAKVDGLWCDSKELHHEIEQYLDQVDPELMALIDEAVELTRSNTALTLIIAFNYGARAEIAKAARALAEKVAAGALDPADINVDTLGAALDTAGIPDPDLLVRTSGEKRISNFLLWQCAYTEFVFLDAFWPDFGRELFEEAIAIYRARERRFGGRSQQSVM